MKIVVEPRVDEQGSIITRFEPEALDDGHASLIENRPLAPGFASIGCEQQEWIARSALQIGARDPAVLEIDELDLVEPGETDAGMRLAPGFAGVFGGEQEGVERGGGRVQIPDQEDFVSCSFYVAQLKKNRARLFFGAIQTGGLRVGFRAFEWNAHGLSRILERSVSAEKSCKGEQRCGTNHKFMLPDQVSLHQKETMHKLNQQLETLVEKTQRDYKGLSDAEAARPAISGGWSRKQILGHLIDSASNNHQRFVRALLQDEVRFPGYDQEGCVRVERYQEARWGDLLDLWASYNRFLAHVLAGLPDAKRDTPCVIGDHPKMTLEELAVDYVRHMEHHLEQIK